VPSWQKWVLNGKYGRHFLSILPIFGTTLQSGRYRFGRTQRCSHQKNWYRGLVSWTGKIQITSFSFQLYWLSVETVRDQIQRGSASEVSSHAEWYFGCNPKNNNLHFVAFLLWGRESAENTCSATAIHKDGESKTSKDRVIMNKLKDVL